MKGNLPMPKVYVIPSDAPNAFATGRNPKHAAVAATTGIVRLLNREELSGVMAHELSHVGNRDILIGTVAAAIAGAISMIAQFAFFFGGRRDDDRGNPLVALAMMIVAPIAAGLPALDFDAADATCKPDLVKLFEGVDAKAGDAMVVYGWTMAEDLVKLGQRA